MFLQLHRRQYSALLSHGALPSVKAQSESMLPFVGRTPELEKVVSFAHVMTSSGNLSLLWIQGESGIGKSRLLTEALQRINSRIAVPIVQFAQDRPANLTHAIVAALKAVQSSAATITIPSNADNNHPDISETIPSVLADLRAFVHLHPTLLVLEDVHLLDPHGINELMTILHGMEHERLGVICTAFPHSDMALGAVLPFLSAQIELFSLTLHEFRDMGYAWNYDLTRLPRLTRFLHKVARGIPEVLEFMFKKFLAYRQELAQNPLAVVRRIARETTDAFSLPLKKGLTQYEVQVARRLATLGEYFSMAGAEMLLDEAPELIDRLCQAGILNKIFEDAPPMFGHSSEAFNYVFAYPILHEQLLSNAPPADDRTFNVTESDVALYSTTIFTFIAGNTPADFDPNRIDAAIQRLIDLTGDLINSPFWEEASTVREAAYRLFRLHRKKISKERRQEIEFHLLRLQLNLLNAFPAHPDFVEAADKLLRITENPTDESSALRRLTALEYSMFSADKSWTFRSDVVFNETEELIRQFPGLLLHPVYINVLGQVTGALRSGTSYETLDRARERFEAIMAAAEKVGNVNARELALLEIAPTFISIFRTPEDLEDRKKLADRISQECGQEMPEGRFAIAWPRFLESVGEMHKAKEVLSRWAHHPLSGYDLSREYALRLLELVIDAALDEDLNIVEERAKETLEEFHHIQEQENSEGEITLAQTAVAVHIILISIMRGEIEWGNRVAIELCDNNNIITGYMQCERAIASLDMPLLHHLNDEEQLLPELAPIVKYVLNLEAASREAALQTARKLLEAPVIQRQNILSIRLVLTLLKETLTNPERSLVNELREEIKSSVERSLEWLTDRRLPAYARPLLKEAEPLLRDDRYGTTTYASIEPEMIAALAGEEELNKGQFLLQPTIRLSVIGTISYTLPGEKPVKVRGARPQQLIGLLIANALLAKPLSLADFRFHVTGSGSADESANYLRVLVSRVRKVLGPDSILTDGETAPRLNPELVQVDLIEASQLKKQALSFARNKLAGQAFEALITALEILSKGEPYPNLSGEIFAAAKEECMLYLREALIATASLLQIGKDYLGAETLLQKGLPLLPHNAELEELLRSVRRLIEEEKELKRKVH